jgi:hypothetical protein
MKNYVIFCHSTFVTLLSKSSSINSSPNSLYLDFSNLKLLISMTEFSKDVVNCISEWSKRSAACNENRECLEQSAKELRQCLNSAFPYSKRIELESDKVNYMLSSVFFLVNRLSKATQGLAEFDRVMSSLEKVGKVSLDKKENQERHAKFKEELDNILAKYF